MSYKSVKSTPCNTEMVVLYCGCVTKKLGNKYVLVNKKNVSLIQLIKLAVP